VSKKLAPIIMSKGKSGNMATGLRSGKVSGTDKIFLLFGGTIWIIKLIRDEG